MMSRNHVKIMLPTVLRHCQQLCGAQFAANNGIKSFSRSERLSSTLRKSSGKIVRCRYMYLITQGNNFFHVVLHENFLNDS